MCHPECGDQGCDGPGADQCLNCVHFSLGNAKTGRRTKRTTGIHGLTFSPGAFVSWGAEGFGGQLRSLPLGPFLAVGLGLRVESAGVAEGEGVLCSGSGRKCVSECPLGYFGDAAARRCRRCHRGCETCSGRSPTQCLSCRRGFFHHQEMSTCVNPCPAGFYASDSQRKCLKCHPSCQKCVDDPEKCTVCKEGFSLARGSCIPDCEPGTYFDSELVRCGQCHPTCKTCVGPSREECIHCASNLHFQDWKCVPACGEGFYPEAMPGLPHRVCRRCDENCLSCEGSSRNCSRCKAGLTQLGASCVANHTCSNADETFCEMVKSQRLCERKLFIQFCCRTCLRAG